MKLGWFACLLGLFLASGCGSKPPPPPAPPPPTRIVAELSAAFDLNPNPLGQPSPVQLRLYELKTPSVFNNADFFALFEQEKATLGADLLAQDQLLLKPGETRRLERTLQADTRYLGLLAAYREVDQAQWRALLAVPPNQTTAVKIDAQRLGLAARTTAK